MPIAEPQEMNTVIKGSVVKTIEAQKEIFLCDLDNDSRHEKKVDLVLFTDIWENLNRLPGNTVVQESSLSFRCVVNTDEAEVESCTFQPHKLG
jgi:hypothetical protein